MAKKKLATVIRLDEYRGRPRKSPTPDQKAFDDLTTKISKKDYRFEGGLGSLVKLCGYSMFPLDGVVQVYTKDLADGTHYLANRDFMTGEPAFSTIVLDGSELEMLEQRLVNITFGAAAKAREERYQPEKVSRTLPIAMACAGAVFTAVTYAFTGLEAAAITGAVSVGIPASVYFIARAVNNHAYHGPLPYRIAKRQILAKDNSQKFFEAAFGVDALCFPGQKTPPKSI